MKPIGEDVLGALANTAITAAERIKEYFAHRGESKEPDRSRALDKAKIGTGVVSVYARLRASQTLELANEKGAAAAAGGGIAADASAHLRVLSPLVTPARANIAQGSARLGRKRCAKYRLAHRERLRDDAWLYRIRKQFYGQLPEPSLIEMLWLVRCFRQRIRGGERRLRTPPHFDPERCAPERWRLGG